jgi:Peptidase A4 family
MISIWGPAIRVRNACAGALVSAAVLAGAPAALANTSQSTNWAGYAIHRTGLSFREVSATWTVPGATCVAGQPTYSAEWVGLGGYRPTSDALEQTGTETDCNAAGQAVTSAWFELVPAPSKTVSLHVEPGDAIHATVTVTGHRVTIGLDDETSGRSFHKTLNASSIDVSSAEWIVEAPSECVTQYACQALPLADFGSVPFASASATSKSGAVGTIANPRWARTRIDLIAGAERLIVARNASDASGTAAPSALQSSGSAFDVTYAAPSSQGEQPQLRAQPDVRAGYIRH